MRRFGLAIIVAALGLAVADGAANAAVIYDNGGPNQPTGTGATRSVNADDFTLGAGGAVGGAGVYITGIGGIGHWDGTVDYFVFADNSGSPGAVLASGSGQNATTTDTGMAMGGLHDIFLVEFDLESVFDAAAGTTYWLGIHLAADFDWGNTIYWVTTAANGTNPSKRAFEGSLDNWGDHIWPYDPMGQAFFLTGGERVSVPEPSALALLGAGLVGLGLIRARRTV
jgi:hypothetical protein